MRYGFVLPGGPAREQVEQAVLAEAAGWDGVFVWEGSYGPDAWSLLGAMAARTSRVRLGTMLTPLPWRRPWQVASQAATLDQLSGGRAILTVGLGALGFGEWREVVDRRQRAELLDEGIDLIATLWEGGLRYDGRHYGAEVGADLAALVTAVQRPRIPIWVTGVWPRPKSMRRVLRCDGLVPMVMENGQVRETTPDDIRAMVAWLDANGGRRPGFDVVMEGETPADDLAAGAAAVRPWAEAGVTWWLDTRWGEHETLPRRTRATTERLRAGPPKP